MRINVRLQPKASFNRLVREEGGSFKVYVTAPPHDNKANRALVGLLADELGVKKSSVKIVSGLKSRDKVVEID